MSAPEIKRYRNKINVIAYHEDHGACRGYRIYYPINALQLNYDKEFNTVIAEHPQVTDLDIFDIMIFQRAYSEAAFKFISKAKSKGIKVVYEVDDNCFNVPNWNPTYNIYSNPKIRNSMIRIISACDHVFVTTQPLADFLLQYNPKIYVLPNSIAFDSIVRRPANNKRVVVGYQGSSTHNKDLSLVSNALAKLTRHPKVLVKLFSEYKLDGALTVPPVPFIMYYPALANCDFDVGVAPLVDIPFNACKSNLKVLEYFAMRTVAVASNVYPYNHTINNGVTGFLVNTPNQWEESIVELVENESKRKQMEEDSFSFVSNNFDVNKTCLLWRNALKEIHSGSGIELLFTKNNPRITIMPSIDRKSFVSTI